MNGVLDQLGKIGIIPVVVIDNISDADGLADALLRGGIPCAEVTFRTEAAEEAIRRLTDRFQELLVGAGTVLSLEQAKCAVSAGARFIVSPGTSPDIVQYCIENSIPIIPGVQTPTEIELAMKYGIDVVKFFPSELAGGVKMLKALAAPYQNIKFVPTGGINVQNVGDYLEFDKVLACGGSWMVNKELIKKRQFSEIQIKVAEAAAIVKKYRG